MTDQTISWYCQAYPESLKKCSCGCDGACGTPADLRIDEKSYCDEHAELLVMDAAKSGATLDVQFMPEKELP